jgi:hypothetical protein
MAGGVPFALPAADGYAGSETAAEKWQLPWQREKRVNRAYRRVAALGLEQNLLDLEVYGLTVLTPSQINAALGLADGELCHRMLDATMRIASEDSGVEHDQERGVHSEGVATTPGSAPTQFLLYSYLTRDPVFELVVQHPLALPLIEYYLGNDCNLSSLTCFIKWAGGRSEGKGMGMHIDSAAANKNGEPSPSTQAPHVFNTNWILTDYTQENGCFAIIPGSHRWQRRPMVEHMEQLHAEEEMVPVEAPAGSCLIFHGNVWHGAFDKKTNGAYSTADSISQHAAIHWPVARCVPLVGTASALLLRKLRRRFA